MIKFKVQDGETVWWTCKVESINPLASGGVVLASRKVLYRTMFNYVLQRGEVEFFTFQSVIIKTDHEEQMPSWEFDSEDDGDVDQKDENNKCRLTAGPYSAYKRLSRSTAFFLTLVIFPTHSVKTRFGSLMDQVTYENRIVRAVVPSNVTTFSLKYVKEQYTSGASELQEYASAGMHKGPRAQSTIHVRADSHMRKGSPALKRICTGARLREQLRKQNHTNQN